MAQEAATATTAVRVRVEVEVCQRQESLARVAEVREHVSAWMDAAQRSGRILFHERGPLLLADGGEDAWIAEHVERVEVVEMHAIAGGAGDDSGGDVTGEGLGEEEEQEETALEQVSFWQAELVFHVFRLSEEVPDEEFLDEEGDIAAYEHFTLPGRDVHGLWESIVVAPALKRQLLHYSQSALFFSDRNVDSNLISWNRMILLHGPPGTGKTSLCKALAHKLAIRFSERFQNISLIEVNAHSLFSKWFSESGKLVMRLFHNIQELAEDRDSFVFVLVDEVESLTAARSGAMGGSEPGDAIRVVNAVLTQLDGLRKLNNVMILATSNISAAIDDAFLDRADLKLYIGPPNLEARYTILRTCLRELVRVGIVSGLGAGASGRAGGSMPLDQNGIAPWSARLAQFLRKQQRNVAASSACSDRLDTADADAKAGSDNVATATTTAPMVASTDPTEMLAQIAQYAEGLSGRALRKLPLQAHAKFVQRISAVPLTTYLVALRRAVREIAAAANVDTKG